MYVKTLLSGYFALSVVALPVVVPETLSEIQPDLVLISNALYEAEISTQVRAMGLAPDFDVIAG